MSLSAYDSSCGILEGVMTQQKKEKLLVLDLDHTLFNTTIFVRDLQKRFARDFDISPDDFMKYRNEVKACCTVIDVDLFVEHLPNPDKEAMHAAILDTLEKKGKEYLYTDVIPFLSKAEKEYEIIILTHGDTELQHAKIASTGLDAHGRNIISLENKSDALESCMDGYEEVNFVDDKVMHIDDIKQTFPNVRTYLIVRPEDSPYASQASTCDCADVTIPSLHDILKKT